MKRHILLSAVLLALLTGCTGGRQVMDGNGMVNKTYTQISQDEAREMMEQDDGHIIVDVRRQDEYDAGHIPGAILISNEDIGEIAPPEELPDLDQIILVYCRSGNRSKQASQKLANLGYTNVYEFGGIIDWTGEVVTEDAAAASATDNEAMLRFESFDGGGPEFTVHIDDEELVSYDSFREYANADHNNMTGSGYDVVFTFTGKKAGETDMLIEERSPIADNLDRKYRITVSDDLSVQIEEISVRDIYEEPAEEEEMTLFIGDEEVPVIWEDNESVEALKDLCPLTIDMSMYGDFEQVGSIGQSIVRDDKQTTTNYGDIVLYSGNQIVVFYGSNSWAYTRLGHVELLQEEITSLLGNGDVVLKLE